MAGQGAHAAMTRFDGWLTHSLYKRKDRQTRYKRKGPTDPGAPGRASGARMVGGIMRTRQRAIMRRAWPADELEDQVRSQLIDRQIADLIYDEQPRDRVGLEFLVEAVLTHGAVRALSTIRGCRYSIRTTARLFASRRVGHRHPRAPRIAPNPRSGAAGTAAFSMRNRNRPQREPSGLARAGHGNGALPLRCGVSDRGCGRSPWAL